MKKIIGLCVIFLVLGVFFSCGEKEPAAGPAQAEGPPEPAEAVTETEDLAPVEAPEFDEGLITFFSGDVFVRDGEEWWEVAIGDMLQKDDVLKTEAASYCEIQFGDTAVVRVQENTEIVMRNVALTPGEANVNVGMKNGSVLAKVKKLGGDESVKIQTQTAVCGVRGTEFSVTADEERGTNLAVKEGSVAVLPSSVDVESLKEKVGEDNEELIKLIEELEQTASVVEANQEIDVDQTAMKETEETAKLIEEAVEEIVETAEAEEAAAGESKPPVVRRIDPAKLAGLQKAIAQTKTEVAQKAVRPKEISEENTEKLREIDRMKMIALPVRAAEPAADGGDAPAEEKIELIKVSLQVEPKDARIQVNGEEAGKGKFSGIYNEGEELSFLITFAGHKDHSLDITVSEETGKLYKIQLAKAPAAEPEPDEETAEAEPKVSEGPAEAAAEAEKDETPAEKEGTVKPEEAKETAKVAMKPEKEEPKIVTSTVAITTVPGDAEITVNGMRGGTGAFRNTYEEGTALNIAVQRGGYEPQQFTLTVGKTAVTRAVTLKAKTIQYDVPLSAGQIVGTVSTAGGRFYAADSGGTVSAADAEGRKLWSFTTANAPNENSYPVLIGGSVYFTGSKELVIANAANGAVISRVPLDAQAAHLFGRRVVPSNAGILLPTNESIRIINAATGAAAGEISVPKGSRMTPAVWNNKIIIADQQGSLLIINPNSKNPVEAEISTAAVQPVALAPSISGNKAVFSGRKGTVVCVDLASKQVLWEKKLPGGASVFTDIACSGSGVYAYAKGSIYAISLDTGADLFAPISGASSPPQCAGENIVYGAGSQLVIRNAENGRVVRSIAVPGNITTKPMQAAANFIVGTDGGHLLYVHP
jgi:outer membrane protein assembly factor BamB